MPQKVYTEIYTVEQFDNIRDNRAGNYRLMADIDLEGNEWEPIGASYSSPFAGVLDGNGFVVKNLYINRPDQYYVGLFGYNMGTIKNLGVEGGRVTGSSYTGGLVGYSNGIILQSYVTIHVYGGSYTGGFVGFNEGIVLQSYATGNVGTKGDSNVGGFVGYTQKDGSNDGVCIIADCFSIGNVSGTYNSAAAGFVGSVYNNAIVENCYSAAKNKHRFFNYNYSGIITSSYFSSDVSTRAETRTPDQMKTQSSYIGWDFETVWEIEEGQSYPTLRRMKKPVAPYKGIYTADQLAAIKDDLLGNYRLMTDIDLEGIDWTPIGSYNEPFAGTLDGNGYVIKNVTINLPNQDYVGVIGRNSGVIMNLGIVGGSVTGKDYTGGLVGENIGYIQKSYTSLNVQGSSDVGGFVGYVSGGLIEQCYAVGNVNHTSSANNYSNSVGGFAGFFSSYAYNIEEEGTIRNSFSTGDVAGYKSNMGYSSYEAGFVGNNYGTIENCYSLANNANGFTGANSYGTVSNSYFDNDLLSIPSAKPEARTTEQMMAQNTYIGWDFNTIWEIEEGTGYPTLRGVTKPIINNDFVEIYTAEQLNGIRNDLTGRYRLMATIDLEGIDWLPIGTGIVPFAGVLDGNGYVIKNLTINQPELDYVGLIGYNSGRIMDIGIDGGQVIGRNYTGSLVGYNTGNIRNSYSTSDVRGYGSAGGLVGETAAGTIDQCFAAGDVANTGYNYAGGFVGVMQSSSTIRNCYATGNVTNENGGIYYAGFIGYISSGTIENCYSIGINPNGFTRYSMVSNANCYFDNDLLGIYPAPSEARTTAQMMSQANYIGWDFDTIWEIEEGVSYPTLQMTGSSLTDLQTDKAWLTFAVIKGTNESENAVTENLWLPSRASNGSQIIWSSDTPDVISGTGAVTRPAYKDGDTVVTLTATLTNGKLHDTVTFTLTVKAVDPIDAQAPSITIQPSSVTGFIGDTFELTLEAIVSEGDLTYQWYESADGTNNNGNLILGATQPSYYPPTDTEGIWYYYCEVTNTDTTATGIQTIITASDCVTVTVNGHTYAETPNIIEQPSDVTVTVSEPTSLTVAATVLEGTLSYQWYESIDGSNGTPIPDAIQPSYTPPTDTEGVRYYYCVITNTDITATGNQIATATSMIVAVTVNLLINAAAPTIIAQPIGGTVFTNEPITLTVEVAPTSGALTYQWYENTVQANYDGIPVFGATEPVFNPPTDTAGLRYYYCVITNTDLSATGSQIAISVSDAVSIVVNDFANAEVPNITGYPSDITVAVGELATLSVDATVTSGTLTYQWYESADGSNGTPIPDAIQPSYTPPTDTEGVRYYYCVITNTDITATGSQTAVSATNTVAVTVKEFAYTYSISLDKNDTYPFRDETEGYASQEMLTVSITNTGTGTITGLQVETENDWLMITQPLQSSIAANESVTFTVTPKGGLFPGTYTSDIWVTGDNGVSTSFTVRFTVSAKIISPIDPQPNPDPVEPPNPPEPEPSPEPTPDPNNDTIMINGQPVEIEPGEDGALRITFTEEDIQQFEDSGGEYNIVIEDHVNIMTFISISALKENDLSIKTDFGTIFIPNAALASIKASYGNMLRLIIKRGSFYIALLDENDNEIAYFDPTNPLTLTLPYELLEEQYSSSVVAIDKDGLVIPFAVHSGNEITFQITETGRYDVRYNQEPFTDIAGHWAEDSLNFVAARYLYSGNGRGMLNPNGAMTRAMFAQLLANLDGVNLSVYSESRFSDVSADSWYMKAVEWAADMGIVEGDGNGKFNPDRIITREQMAVMLYNYIQYRGIQLPHVNDTTPFADEGTISSWAVEAVRAIQGAGIIGGKPGNLFDPETTATRAEVATIFTNFIMGVVRFLTANSL